MFRARYLSDQERFFKISKRFWEILVWNVHFCHFQCHFDIPETFVTFLQWMLVVKSENSSNIKRFLYFGDKNFRVFFFGTESDIFERFRASAFQNTKNYRLTPKTRKDAPLWIRCGWTGNRRVLLLREDFEAKFGSVKIGCMRTSISSKNLENHAISL